MDLLRRPHVHAVGGVHGQNQPGPLPELPGQDHLLHVPPGEEADGGPGGRRLDPEAADELRGLFLHGPTGEQTPPGEAGVAAQGQVLRHAHRPHHPHGPVLGDVGHPQGVEAGGVPGQGGAQEPHLPPVGPKPRQGLHELLLPASRHPGHAEDLPFPEHEAHPLDRDPPAGHEEVPHLQKGPLPRREAEAGRLHLPPHHEAHEEVPVRLLPRHLPHLSPPPEDGDAVRHPEHLVQLVADEDHREAHGLVAGDLLEKALRLLGGEDAGGLVQDQDLGLGEKGPEDLHPLLLPGGEEVDGRLQVHPQRVPRQQGLEPADEGPSGKQEGQVQPQGQVLGHGVGLNELGVLGHEGDAQGLGRLGGGDLDGAPLQEDPPLVRRVKAVEEAHQGGLPRPVLPQEGEDLPGPHLEADAVVGHHRAEAFRDVLQPQHPPPEEDTTPTGGRPCGWR